MVAEYLDFISILFALYVVAGGILVTGTLRGTSLLNAAMLGVRTLIASVIGTTGAAMILIRPLLRANAGRPHNVHVVVFFIFLVGNIGGALSPLGDPPLFIGFLNGVDFFWPLQNLWRQTVFVAACVLVIFVLLDLWYCAVMRGSQAVVTHRHEAAPLKSTGSSNLPAGDRGRRGDRFRDLVARHQLRRARHAGAIAKSRPRRCPGRSRRFCRCG